MLYNNPISHKHAIAAESVRAIKRAVDSLLALYDDDEGGNNMMNETQPPSFAACIPMSLDAWSLELGACADDWDASALAFHNCVEHHKRRLQQESAPPPMMARLLDLGFVYEFPGQYELHAPNGSRVGCSGEHGSGEPTADSWCVCFYPPGHDGEPLAFDMRSNDGRGASTFERALLAALILAGVDA